MKPIKLISLFFSCLFVFTGRKDLYPKCHELYQFYCHALLVAYIYTHIYISQLLWAPTCPKVGMDEIRLP